MLELKKGYKVLHYWLPIYCRNVYMVVWDDLDKMQNMVKKRYEVEHGDLSSTGYCLALSDTDFVLFFNVPIYYDTIAHECTHLKQYLMEKSGFYDGILSDALWESEAYLVGELYAEVLERVEPWVQKRPWKITTRARVV